MKVRLKALGLPVSGNKPVLLDRLETVYSLKPDEEPSDDDEDPFSSNHSEDEIEHHSPLTHPPTNAQLWALTTVQMKVRLKALGLSVNGRAVQLDSIKTRV